MWTWLLTILKVLLEVVPVLGKLIDKISNVNKQNQKAADDETLAKAKSDINVAIDRVQNANEPDLSQGVLSSQGVSSSGESSTKLHSGSPERPSGDGI